MWLVIGLIVLVVIIGIICHKTPEPKQFDKDDPMEWYNNKNF